MQTSKRRLTDRVFYITFGVNGALMIIKLAAGIIGKSGAMLSDAVHTISDIAVTALAMAAVGIAGKKCDDKHPYGHEKIESVAGLMLAFVLAITAFMIGKSGVETILQGKDAVATPGAIALVAAVVSILSQEALYRIARYAGEKAGSPALVADAWHHRTDALSSVGSLVGIGAARWLGIWYMEPAASILICLFIMYTAVKIGIDCVNQMIDTAPDAEKLCAIRESILGIEGVSGLDVLNCRRHANRLFVDIEVAIASSLSFEESHDICEMVHKSVERSHPEVIHCTVHANPDKLQESADKT